MDLDGVQMKECFAQVLMISVGNFKVIEALYTFTLSICAGRSSTDAHDQASSGQVCLPLPMPLQTAVLDDFYRPY